MTLIWLLPIAAVVSWWLGRRSVRINGSNKLRSIHPEYFKGLNYVLNEQPDKAIEVFIKMLEVDSETVETHLALGNLFRRRGEVDRAIRIHQNLIARPTLNREQRALALLELGMDYMRSGLLDRAEGLFKELVETGSHSVHAFSELLDIYQQEKDWDNAINIARKLEFASGESLNAMIAQFYCEKAEEQRLIGQEKSVKENLRRALTIDPVCVRASIIEAEELYDNGKFKQAINAYQRIEHQDPEYLSEAVIPMLNCYRNLDNVDEYMQYLRNIVDKYGGITSMLTLAELIADQQGEEAAAKFIISELKKRPTVRGVNRLIEYALAQAQGGARENLISIKDLTGKLLENRSIYKCRHCGFDAKTLHWQCPSCKNWNTVKPVHGVEGE
ncbi:MAG: lipopolysaccharide assembly protein LapB [Gammaproteobacteria bacterium]|nr:lipopolysaccharide assembly protein LapB [Gammaproteobacteria bacterium]